MFSAQRAMRVGLAVWLLLALPGVCVSHLEVPLPVHGVREQLEVFLMTNGTLFW